jgi:L-threonylcarbamoyladenylate synthase
MHTETLAPDEAGFARAASLLAGGELVAFPTETVYGLGADACDDLAVAKIFQAKGRPSFNPLICHFSDAAAAFGHVEANPRAQALAAKFWPGPVTLVLPRRCDCPVSQLAGAGLTTLAVRVPSHPAAQKILRAVGRPIAAPSANISGGVSPTTAAHVWADLGSKIAAILESGPATIGLESTVLDMSGPESVLLRPGAVLAADIEAIVGKLGLAAIDSAAPHGPGMLASHYAPGLPVRLHAVTAQLEEALLAFGPNPPPATLTWNLSESGDLAEAASRLFAGLRWLDEAGHRAGLRGIAAMTVPAIGLGLAINDRLSRAAAPK